MKKKDYYEILKIDQNADAYAIKVAYRKLAMEFHPDISADKDAEERFKEISEAYAVLSDREKRRQYDRGGLMDIFESYRQGGFFGGCGGRGMGMGRGCGRGGFIRRQFQTLKNKGNVKDGEYIFNLPLSSVEALNGIEKNIYLNRGNSVKQFSVIIPQNSQDGDLIKIDATALDEGRNKFYLKIKINT